jgi:hypothetical protein
VATVAARPGPFRVEYPRAAEDAGPFLLRAEAPRRPPALLALPTRAFDAGEVRLLAGLTYGGRLVDGNGRPVAGAVVDFLAVGDVAEAAQAAVSAPSAADGSFLIPLPSRAFLGALFGDASNEWVRPPRLEARLRGRLFLPVDAVPEGILGKHEVVLEERPVALRLRLLDGGTGQPIAGASVSLLRRMDIMGWGAYGTAWAMLPVDEGVADDQGVFAPLWPLAYKGLLVRLQDRRGRVYWTVLDRIDAEGPEPRDITVPAKPLVLAVRCLDATSGQPMAGVDLLVGTNAPCALGAVTDAKGEARWALVPTESFDPEPLEVTGWSATWRDASGAPRREATWDFQGPAGGEEEGPSAIYREPLVLRLGKGTDPGIWVTVKEAPGAAPFRPGVLRVETGLMDGSYCFMASLVSGPFVDATGRTLWWTWENGLEDTQNYIPADRKVKAELVAEGRDPLVIAVDRPTVLAAHRAEGALVFATAPVEAMTRTLLVLRPDGGPAAGTIVVVLPGAAPQVFTYQPERSRAAAGPDGRVSLDALDPRGDCRVAAWDPATGAGGVLPGLDETAPPERWRLVLEAPREFRVTVKLAGGAPMQRAGVNLSPLSYAFPYFANAEGKDGVVVLPACALPLYRAWVYGFGPGSDYRLAGFSPRGDYRFKDGPAVDFNGKEIVLQKR